MHFIVGNDTTRDAHGTPILEIKAKVKKKENQQTMRAVAYVCGRENRKSK